MTTLPTPTKHGDSRKKTVIIVKDASGGGGVGAADINDAVDDKYQYDEYRDGDDEYYCD
ncbi:hypothetical protein DPMN_071313 [Dreissena polymorpha]|uniref:Uncharacterized protein n=1 Tax=Dreissena polymorpha TaxID=45954 RepID=A0A9D3Z788_DREPO|nr:hypothetical protein DPMN_071313 [Dreissena polymorpha]